MLWCSVETEQVRALDSKQHFGRNGKNSHFSHFHFFFHPQHSVFFLLFHFILHSIRWMGNFYLFIYLFIHSLIHLFIRFVYCISILESIQTSKGFSVSRCLFHWFYFGRIINRARSPPLWDPWNVWWLWNFRLFLYSEILIYFRDENQNRLSFWMKIAND